MKKITGQFTKYTVILLIVGAILVLIGGLSVGRKAIANQREIALDMSARTRVDVISKENTQLKNENAQLKKDIETATAEKSAAEQKAETIKALLMAERYLDDEDIEKAKEEIEKVDKALLPDELKEIYDEIVKAINE